MSLLKRRQPTPPATPNGLTRDDLQPILDELRTMNQTLARLTLRESQLRAVLRRDAELDRHLGRLDRLIDKGGSDVQITNAVQRADLCLSPFPHAVVDNVLPDGLYQCVVRGIPPVELFADRPVNKRQLTVPFDVAPTYSQRVWRHLAYDVIPHFVLPAIVDKFREPLYEWMTRNWPDIPPESVRFTTSDGRILLRGRGYRIPPHRDPKWGFLTCILYLAREGDSETWGTQLFSVEEDVEARGAAPHWIDTARCRQVADVTFRPNRMLVFLNSVGAHGAQIPADAEPADLERYIYQFRIGPEGEAISRLMTLLPDERRPFWAGKSVDY